MLMLSCEASASCACASGFDMGLCRPLVPFAKLTDSALLSLSELERRRKEGIRVELCSREGEGVGRPERGSSWGKN